MNPITTTQELPSPNKADWLVMYETILQVGYFPVLDNLLHRTLNTWLEQITPELRWKIAIDLYTTEQISSGRAAEIAGLNYFVFEEKLRENGINFIEAESITETQKEQQQALIHELFNFPEA